jgi:hypothetical protein
MFAVRLPCADSTNLDNRETRLGDNIVRTFSGTHDWHPSVLNDTDAAEQGNADEIIENIEHGVCPRCEGPLPTMPEYPAGYSGHAMPIYPDLRTMRHRRIIRTARRQTRSRMGAVVCRSMACAR